EGGPANVVGARLTFGAMHACTKPAEYVWTLVSETELVLTPVGTDPCARADDLGDGHLRLDTRDVYINYAVPLTGPIPDALAATWQGVGTTGHRVLSGHRAAFIGEDATPNIIPAGASAADITFGPRVDGGCQWVGLYRWQVIGGSELLLTHGNIDSCPRATGFKADPWNLLSRS